MDMSGEFDTLNAFQNNNSSHNDLCYGAVYDATLFDNAALLKRTFPK